LRALRRGALARSITGYHKNMVRKQYPVLELANQMPVRNMDLARAPLRTARKKGSGYENVENLKEIVVLATWYPGSFLLAMGEKSLVT
jgi:hypothetical protein